MRLNRGLTEAMRMARFGAVYEDFQKARLGCDEAALMLGCSVRHFLRLRERYDESGLEALRDGRVGRVSQRRAADAEVPPEQLLLALLLQVFFGVRSERQLMEQMRYNFLYRWFTGLGMDGALIEAWASHKSFRPKDAQDSGGDDNHGDKRRNGTHQSVTGPDARLYKKSAGKEAKLAYMGHALMENRSGLAVDGVPAAPVTPSRRSSASASRVCSVTPNTPEPYARPNIAACNRPDSTSCSTSPVIT